MDFSELKDKLAEKVRAVSNFIGRGSAAGEEKLADRAGTAGGFQDKLTEGTDKLGELRSRLAEKISTGLEALFLYRNSDSEDVKQRAKRNVYIVSGIGIFLVAAISVALLNMNSMFSEVTEVSGGEKVYVRIVPGMSSSQVGELLEEQGIIDSRLKFWLAVKLNDAGSKLQVGVFELQRDMQAGDALNVLINGHAVAVRVTVPEGLNVRQVAKLFAASGLADEQEFLDAARDFAPYDYIEAVPEADYRIEGFLFPDTYDFASDATPRDVMQRMADEFDSRLTADMRQQAEEEGLSIYELVNLASLVEKEAKYSEDRPIIAQVFFKRLAIDMPLQSDTTLQYLRDEVKEDLTFADTEVESPYNTYLHYGLPPGPIASPGMESIEAVLNPADTDYLYFVADHDGHNHYGYTYDEHLELVEQVR